MAKERKYVFGRGELLSSKVDVPRAGGKKNAPYEFSTAVKRMAGFLSTAHKYLDHLPDGACPAGKAVASITLHPRFISKSDFPSDLFVAAGMTTVGGRTEFITPDAWGIEKHPESTVTDTYYVAATRQAFHDLSLSLSNIDPQSKAAYQLQNIERLYVPTAAERFKRSADLIDEAGVYEVVLHSEDELSVLDGFYEFAEKNDVNPVKKRVRFAKNVIFVPIEADNVANVENVAQFSFLRAVRKMPRLRTFRPPILRADYTPVPDLPSAGETASQSRIVIFDGGLPDNSPLEPWVERIDPPGIGPAVADALAHGEQVTSAFLFGHLTPKSVVRPPFASVDHVRVIDDASGHNGDYELYDVLDRVLNHLDQASTPYQLVNLSLGPDLPVDDDDITAWTAELDQRASNGSALIVCAAGNSGNQDSSTNLNRIQPPSDGVNLLAVGACTSLDIDWSRCDYSSVGPGRTPGVAKPDGLAFGGCFEQPFGVVTSTNGVSLNGTYGTSFAAPLALRTAAGLGALVDSQLSPLAMRALLVHTTEPGNESQEEVGWGRFGIDPLELISCSDDEVTVIYQGELPLGQHLRAPLPIGTKKVTGQVQLTATLVIAPEVDAAFANAYTRGGLQVVFRPNMEKSKSEEQAHPDSESFFSDKHLYKAAEYRLRLDGHKWEPCLKTSRSKQGKTLFNPCFDIYYHTRDEGHSDAEPQPIPYVFIVTLKAPKVPDLYDATLEAFDALVPIKPVIEIGV